VSHPPVAKGANIGVAVVGLGVGEQHALAYARDPRCELHWLYDLSRDQAQEVQARVGQGELAQSYDAVLADPKTSILSIATYDDLHYAEVLKAFAAGKHVFVEKPLCRTVDELQHVVQAWRNGGRPHLEPNIVP